MTFRFSAAILANGDREITIPIDLRSFFICQAGSGGCPNVASVCAASVTEDRRLDERQMSYDRIAEITITDPRCVVCGFEPRSGCAPFLIKYE